MMSGMHHGLEGSCTSEQDQCFFLGLLQVLLLRVSSFERCLPPKC